MLEKDFDNNNENILEFLNGEHYTTVTFCNRKHINRVKNIYSERSSEFKYFHENNDGSVVAKFPTKWFKINPGSAIDPNKPKRILTEEHLAKLQAARLNKLRSQS